jgi:hypothetical protein
MKNTASQQRPRIDSDESTGEVLPGTIKAKTNQHISDDIDEPSMKLRRNFGDSDEEEDRSRRVTTFVNKQALDED